MAVVYSTLQVLISLAKNCEAKFSPRFVKNKHFPFKVFSTKQHSNEQIKLLLLSLFQNISSNPRDLMGHD